MKTLLTPPKIRFLAGLFTNLAATWLAVAFVAPGFGGSLVCSWLAIKAVKSEQHF